MAGLAKAPHRRNSLSCLYAQPNPTVPLLRQPPNPSFSARSPIRRAIDQTGSPAAPTPAPFRYDDSVSIPKPLALFALAACTSACAQIPQVVCDHGIGHFDATYLTGVTLHVAPVKSGAFATRACQAELLSGAHRTIVVPSALQIDIDVLGADLGFGTPVVAFVVQPTPDAHKSYEIWSLDKTPRSRHTLTGENSYRAVDADFNGQLAIWTTDSAAAQALETLTDTNDLSPPIVALKFEHGHLLDVSSWYRPQYDRQISSLRSHLTPGDLADVRNSDDLSDSSPRSSTDLRRAKATILEIVCAYLYSGRPERAWAELDSAWPAAGIPKIKAALLAARAHGIETQLANLTPPPLPPRWLEPARLYQYLKPSGQPDSSGGRLMYGAPGVSGTEGPVLVKDQDALPLYAADKDPVAITLWRPPPTPQEQSLPLQDESILLLIDAAGKVHSARMLAPRNDPALLQAATDWKFIPASLDGKPVAYQLNMTVSLLR